MILVGKDARLRADTRAHLTSTGKVQVVAESSDFARAMELVEQLNPHGAVVILDGDDEPTLGLVRQIAQGHPGTTVVCTGVNSQNDLIIKAFRAGAREFFVQPPKPNDLKDMIERLEELMAAGEGERKSLGTVISVYSSKGGSGTTTIGVNLAAVLAKQTGRQTAIVDLNLQHGNIPIFFGIDPSYSITDVARNEQRLDVQLFRSFLTKVSDNLYCLAAPIRLEEADDVFPNHLETAIGLLRTQFSFVVLDTQHTLDPNTVAGLDLSDVILLITQLDLASVYNTRRVLETFSRMGYSGEKVRVVVNRHTKGNEMPLEKVKEVLGQKVFFMLGDDGRAVRESLTLGKPLIVSQPKSHLIKQFADLAKEVTTGGAREEKKEKDQKGLLTIFGKRGK
jgi:pilus assembly protein CpaE